MTNKEYELKQAVLAAISKLTDEELLDFVTVVLQVCNDRLVEIIKPKIN